MHTRVDRIDDGVTKIMSEDEYSIEHIQVLSGIEGVRKRPGMYFGRTDYIIERFVYELVSNVLDCYVSDTATFASIEIDEGTITVVDDGPGLPFDRPSDIEGMTLATKSLTHLHFTGSEDGHAPHIHVGYPDGVGLAAVNAASSHLNIQSWRDRVCWEQKFSQGIPLGEPIIIDRGIGCGTRIEVTPDSQLFRAVQPRSNIIRQRLFETAHLVKGFEIRFHQERFYAPQGLVQMLPFIKMDTSDSFNYSLAIPDPFYATVKRECISIDAVAYGNTQLASEPISSINTKIYSWVNGGMLPAGGSHVTGFLTALNKVNWCPEIIMIHVVMFDPRFAGPMKTKLAVPKIAKIVKEALRAPLEQYCASLGNKDPRHS
jgi:DNA gyrase subunit B